MGFRWLPFRRGERVRARSGLRVPPVRVIGARRLRLLVAAAEREGLGVDVGAIGLDAREVYLLLPYGYEHRPVRSWKCRVFAFAGGVAEGRGAIRLGRVDVAAGRYRRLRRGPRRVERQLLHWLAWEAAASSWGRHQATGRDSPGTPAS